MPKSLYEGNIKLTALTAAPGNVNAISAAALNAAVQLAPAVLRSGYRLSPVGSDTLSEPSLEDMGNSVTFGSSNYEATFTLFRYLLSTGKTDAANDIAYNLFTGKGVALWLVERIGPLSTTAWAANDVYNMFPVITDDPQAPTELSGYVKFVQPLGVQSGVVLRGTAVA